MGEIGLGTVVLGLSFCYGQFNSPWLATRALGEWVTGPFLLATATLGFYSLVLLVRGRILMAFIGFIIFVLGALSNLPTL